MKKNEPLTTSTLSGLGETHRMVIYYIRKHLKLSRSELAKFCGVSAPAMTNIAKELIARGLIKEAGKGPKTRGQPSTQLSIDPLGVFSLGIHIELDFCSFTLIDFLGKPVFEKHYPGIFSSPSTALPIIFTYINEILQNNPDSTIKLTGIGIAISGNFIIDHHKIIPRKEMSEWKDIDIHDIFTEKYHLPIYVENDASAASMGENLTGKGKHHQDFFYIYMGFGLGGAYIHKNKLIRGINGNAGELGRMCPNDKPRPTLNNLSKTLNLSVDELTTNKIETLFYDKDKNLMLWLDNAISNLNLPINAIFNLMDPEVIIISSCFPDALTNYIIDNIAITPLDDCYGYYDNLSLPNIIEAEISDLKAIVYGAAILPFYKYL